ncbi:MAG: hypothetical protein KME26_18140 [Oscillatoria princeps RMCB-10]|jgi:hypothetical protein|nr:hypothetical protein [Oscillatoria princeps RMCB-10]
MVALIKHEATNPHPMARFATVEALALLLNVTVEQIEEIRYWANAILVMGEKFSRFVSYADLPPVLGVAPPDSADYLRWRKRWKSNKDQAPPFWLAFYTEKFKFARSVPELYTWGQLVSVFKHALSLEGLLSLREAYSNAKCWLEAF